MESRNLNVSTFFSRRSAAWFVCLLAGLYVGHVLYVWHMGPLNEENAPRFWVFFVVAGVLVGLLIWAAIAVQRGRSLAGAFVLALLLCAGGAIGAVLASKPGPVRERHAPFIVLEMAIAIWAMVTVLQLGVVSTIERRSL